MFTGKTHFAIHCYAELLVLPLTHTYVILDTGICFISLYREKYY